MCQRTALTGYRFQTLAPLTEIFIAGYVRPNTPVRELVSVEIVKINIRLIHGKTPE